MLASLSVQHCERGWGVEGIPLLQGGIQTDDHMSDSESDDEDAMASDIYAAVFTRLPSAP